MKPSIRLLSILLIVIGIATASGCKQETPVLNVNDVASDPGAYSGTLRIVGVVDVFSKDDPSILGIMDRKELACTSPNCHKAYVAVKVPGKAPVRGDELLVTGTFQPDTTFGQLLMAQEVKVTANHNLGGN